MTQFDFNRALASLMTPEVVSALGNIRELKGRTSLLSAAHPNRFAALVEVAKIQSTSASNKIENISTSDRRLRELMLENVEPKNRDEREIAGYRYVLDIVHESHDNIPITPGVILQLHRDLYRFSGDSHAGRWKDSDNVIAERTAQGELVARFIPTSAAATPGAIEAICNEYRKQVEAMVYDPLLVSLVFAFDFVSIHPFNDGNGRMRGWSRCCSCTALDTTWESTSQSKGRSSERRRPITRPSPQAPMVGGRAITTTLPLSRTC